MLRILSTSNYKKEKNINLKHRYLVLILVLSFATILAQNSINKSPFFMLLDKQIEKNYVPQQMNMGIDELTVTIPMLYVQLVGSAMRDLKSSLNQYPTSLEKYEALHKEILSIIPQIANVYNSTNSSKIGYEYNDATTLEDYYYRALEGIYSENFKQHYKELKGKDITQVNIPFILDIGEPLYKKQAKKDNAIILLGVEAPLVDWRDFGLGDDFETFKKNWNDINKAAYEYEQREKMRLKTKINKNKN